MRGVVSQRKFVYDEYTKAKMTLNEKKNLQLIMDKSKWDLDEKYLESFGVDINYAKTDASLAKKLMLKDV